MFLRLRETLRLCVKKTDPLFLCSFLMSRKKKIRSWVTNGLFIAAMLLLIFSSGAKSWILQRLMDVGLFKAKIKTEQTATVATAFSVTDTAGNEMSTEALKGKVVFINFWATWCPPCKAEMPSLQKLYNQFKNDERVVFLFLNEDDNAQTAITYLKKNNYNLPVSRRAGGIPNEIFSGSLPTTLILDKEGRVVYRHQGVASYDSKAFIAQLEALL